MSPNRSELAPRGLPTDRARVLSCPLFRELFLT